LAHYDVGFKLRHECPFNALSKQFPSVVLGWWTNYDQDVLEVSGVNPVTTELYETGLQKAIQKMGGSIVRQTLKDSTLQLVISWDGKKYEYSTSRVFMKHGCLVLQPTIHTDGWEWYRIVAFAEKDVKALFKELDGSAEVEIVSKSVDEGTVRENMVVTPSSLLAGLTMNQAEALVLALDSGYYRVPKKSTTEDVATRVGVPRTTYEEHLRKAESKVMLSVAPYIQLHVRKPALKKSRRRE